MDKSNIKPNMKPVNPPVHRRYTKQQLIEIIDKFQGLTTPICNFIDCTFTQFYYSVKKYDLEEYLNETRKQLAYRAESVMAELLDSKSDGVRLKAAETTLKYRGNLIGWETNPQVQIQQNIVSDEDTKVKIQNIFGITE